MQKLLLVTPLDPELDHLITYEELNEEYLAKGWKVVSLTPHADSEYIGKLQSVPHRVAWVVVEKDDCPLAFPFIRQQDGEP